MKGLIILILIILVVGLYFQPGLTKKAMKVTGKALAEVTKEAIDKAEESNYTEIIDNNIKRDNKTNSTK